MQEFVSCPVCGQVNPAELEYCQNCQSPLAPSAKGRGAESGPFEWEGIQQQAPGQAEGRDHRLDREAADNDEQGARGAPPVKADRRQQAERMQSADDLLAGLDSQAEGGEEEVPEWVARVTGAPSRPMATAPGATRGDEWNAGVAPGAPQGVEATEQARPSTPTHETSGPSVTGEQDLYAWLRNLDAASPGEPPAETRVEQAASPTPVPEWVKQLGARKRDAAEPPAQAPVKGLPEWLTKPRGSAGPPPEEEPRSTLPLEPEGEVLGGIQQEESPRATFPLEPEGEEIGRVQEPESPPKPVRELRPSLGAEEMATRPSRATSAFTTDGLSGADVDDVFASMQMPDWLSDVRPAEPQAEELPSTAHEAETIEPVELPSWVQAMRPVQAATTEVQQEVEGLPPEEQGPLLGLHGVLPAVPGAAAPSSKPKAQSMRLEATEQQRAHAALLADILAVEAKPIPMKARGELRSQRALRWAVTALVLITVGSAVLSGSRVFPMPAAAPIETIHAVQAVENLNEGAPVLVVFDYEPATVGEMEASAAPLLDHLLLLKHPRLALLSTSPTGAALGERFLATVLADCGYTSGAQYVNLGYLPGGLAGVHAFAQDPKATVPLGVDVEPVWESDVLRGLARLSDFAAIVVLTDNIETGRVWIEQTAPARQQTPMILVSSAQSGPMLLPYVDSGQVSGLVSGIRGAAGVELANGGLPGFVRRYWDAYDVGIYVAFLVIAMGGAWFLLVGIRERRTEVA